MSTLFPATKVAAYAVYAEFKFKPYYNIGFHLDALTSFLFHILRALYDVTAFAVRLIITPFYLLNPLAWISLPDHMMNLCDDLIGFGLSLVSITIHPVLVIIRTLSSIIRGYEEDSEYDWGREAEEEDLQLAMTLF